MARNMECKYSFKARALALLLTLVMVVALIPAFASLAEGEDPDELSFEAGNLAREERVLVSSQYAPHYDPSWGWAITNINDGTLNEVSAGSNGGFHTNVGNGVWNSNHSEWISYQFPGYRTFDTVMVYPCRDQDGVCYGMPNAFSIEVSADGDSWMTVYSTAAYDIPEYGPQIFQFGEITARFVRFNAISLNKDKSGHWALKLAEMAVYDKDYENTEPYCPNLAVGKPVTSSPCHTDGNVWSLGNINDGNPYNMSLGANYGQITGWHTGVGEAANAPAWIEIALGEPTAVDKVVIWPATERYEHSRMPGEEWRDGLYLPLTMKIEVTVDGEEWTEVGSLDTMPTEWGPIEFTFDKTEATAVRLSMTRNGHVKLSEFEIYDTAKSEIPATPGKEEAVYTPGVNLALGGTAFASAALNNNDWNPPLLNNGIIEQVGGFSTPVNGVPPMSCGVEFERLTAVNKLVLYSASTGGDEGKWSGIPKTFKVQYSSNGLIWFDITEVSCETPVSNQDPLTVTFDTVEARYIRIWTDDPWEKPSDDGRTYIQLAEMEVWYTENKTLSSKDAFTAYCQERVGEAAGTRDLRVILVLNESKLADIPFVNVKITFDLAGEEGGTKTVERKLGGTDSDYELYRSITAAGDRYTAAEGCAIFGNVITGIPEGAYTKLSVTVTGPDGTVLLSASSDYTA